MTDLPELHWSAEHGLIYRTSEESLGDGRYVAWERGGRYLNDGLPADAIELTTPPLPQCPETRMSVLSQRKVRCSYPVDHVARMCEYIAADGKARTSWRTGSPELDDKTRCHRFVRGDHDVFEACGCPVNEVTDTCAGGHHPTAADYRELGVSRDEPTA